MVILFKLKKGLGLHSHYHSGFTTAHTIQGKWIYKEKPENVFIPGSFDLEYPGTMHTVEILSEEPVLMFARIQGGFLFVDDMENGNIEMYQDAFYFYSEAKEYYEKSNREMLSHLHKISIASEKSLT
ncbi:hypothetical protein BTJ40_10985 [Microbulbifer sp. A4B17]|nr:hypothetical protein BTJ40_10985 [Microbulbifer sp. A4B17]